MLNCEKCRYGSSATGRCYYNALTGGSGFNVKRLATKLGECNLDSTRANKKKKSSLRRTVSADLSVK